MIHISKSVIHLQNKEPVVNMKLVLFMSLVVVCQAYTPIAEKNKLIGHMTMSVNQQ